MNINSDKDTPLISVVTVVYNGENCINKTLSSVLSQDCDSFEYIVVDGLSTDKTLDIIQKYASENINICSEKDRGIYDAMNKGINLAEGQYVFFLNADDVFVNKHVLTDLNNFISAENFPDVLYGNILVETEYGTYRKVPGELSQLPKKHVISHQATLVKKEILQKFPFNLEYKYAADFEQISSIYMKGYNFSYINKEIAATPLGSGATYDNFKASLKEHNSILKQRGLYSGKEECILLFKKNIVRSIKAVLPEFLSKRLFSLIAKKYKAL